MYKKPHFIFFAIFVSVLIAYSTSLSGGLIWDDNYLVKDNPFFRSPSFILEVFKHNLFLNSPSAYYRPIQNWSYMFDYWLWGTNYFGYHLTNIILHSILASLLFLFLKKKIEHKNSLQIAAWSSLIWAIHPIHNAAVGYISGRADTIAGIFCLCGWLLWLQNVKFKNVILGLLFILGLCSKEISLVWMVLFLIIERKHFKISFSIVLSALFGYMLLRNLPFPKPPQPQFDTNFIGRIVISLRALGDYFSLLIFPYELHMERSVFVPAPNWESWSKNLRWEFLAPLAVLGIVFIKKAVNKQTKWLVLWFFVGFAPISNLFPLNAQVAEHWIYMPSMGAIAFLVYWLYDKKYSKIILTIFLLGLTIRTMVKANDWGDTERFFKKTTQQGGDSFRIRMNQAMVYVEQKNFVEAEKILMERLKIEPYNPSLMSFLAAMEIAKGNNDKAKEWLAILEKVPRAIKVGYKQEWNEYYNRAQFQIALGDKEAARKELLEALKYSPNEWRISKYLSILAYENKDLSQALFWINEFVKRNPWYVEPRLYLFDLQVACNLANDAVANMLYAVDCDIRDPRPYNKLANFCETNKKITEAIIYQELAVERLDTPGQISYLNHLKQIK